MIYLIYLFLTGGILLIVSGILGLRSAAIPAYQRLPVEPLQIKKTKMQNYFFPLFGLSNFILERLNLKERFRQNLAAGHLKLTPEEFFSIKLILMLVLGLLTFFTFTGKAGAILIAALLGYAIPDFWLKKRITQYKQTIGRLFPETVDLLGLCMEAGLDFTAALDWIIKRTKHTAMVEELAFVLEEIRWGKARTQALKDMAKRLDLPEATSFAQTLVQAERMGTPVVEVFNILSEDARLQRFRRGERYALKAPMKMLIPLIFCILPVIAIVIGGPILIQFMGGNMFKGF